MSVTVGVYARDMFREICFRILHNLVAHPLLLIPCKLTQRFHDWTSVWAYPPMAACLVYVRDGQVLAVARRGTTDQWGLPGGKVEGEEPPWDTALRETAEEAQTFPRNLKELYRGVDDDGNSVVTYLTKSITSEPRQGDAGPVAFVPWTDLLSGPFKRYNGEVYKRWLLTE